MVAVALYAAHKDVGKGTKYVSSEACKSCHTALYDGWKTTLHPTIFRPVVTGDEILGDFTSADPLVTFSKDEIEYVIGSKWEQVYARNIDGDQYPFPAVWYVQLKKWAPYKPDTWQDTPMSSKCHGCHVTGFNPETLEFNEYGVGCEACHGPGNTHVLHERKTEKALCSICHRSEGEYTQTIINSVNSSVCGRCHNRGVSTSPSETGRVRFDFPVNVTPGEELTASFDPLTPEKDTQGLFWWGSGLSKNRHQEFADWQNSKHSKALKLLKEKHTDERGKLTELCLRCHSADYRLAAEDKKPSLNTARYGVTCVACHDPHGRDKIPRFKLDATALCGACHVDSMSFKTARLGRPHYPCPPSTVKCADCHMPYIVKTGGFYSIRSHAFQIVRPEATELYGMPNSCQNGACHTGESIEWAKEEYTKFYGADKEPAPPRPD